MPNPSVLIVQKFTLDEVKLVRAGALPDYQVFMAIPRMVGIDKRGNAVHLRTPEGLLVLDDKGNPIVDDDLPELVPAFEDWCREQLRG